MKTMKYILKEYMAETDGERKKRNIAQYNIWKTLSSKGLVDEKDMGSFRKFAQYFNDYRDETGHDLTGEVLLAKPHIIALFK